MHDRSSIPWAVCVVGVLTLSVGCSDTVVRGKDIGPRELGVDAAVGDTAVGPHDSAPDRGTPDRAAPDQKAPDRGTPDQAVADQKAPDQAVADQKAPDQAVTDQKAPDQRAPDQRAPDQAVADQKAPDQGGGGVSWAVKAGATDQDIATGIARDSAGNLYIVGEFAGSATFGSTTLTSTGWYDIFVAKLSSAGVFQWARGLGDSTNNDFGLGIAVDSSGNVYITGFFGGTVAFGGTSLTSTGDKDMFVAKLSSAGVFQWAKKGGGAYRDEGHGVAVDSSGNVFVTGDFYATASFGSTSLTSAGERDMFVTRLSSAGAFQWTRQAGGTGRDNGLGVAVDSSGNVLVAGHFSTTAATFGSTTLTSAGGDDLFVTRLSSAGVFQWARRGGGSSTDHGLGVAVDSSGNALVSGSFVGSATFGSTTLTSAGSQDAFLAKLNSAGVFKWALGTHASPGALAAGLGVAVDSSGNAYLAGFFDGVAKFGSTTLTAAGSQDAFLARVSAAGSFISARGGGGTSTDYGLGVAVSAAGRVHVTGQFGGTARFGSTALISGGRADIFV